MSHSTAASHPSAAAAEQPCAACQQFNTASARFCNWCGKPVSSPPPASSTTTTATSYVARPSSEWQTLGILGGGQLGRMMAEAAHRLNIKTVVLDPSPPPCPAARVGSEQLVGKFTDADMINQLIARVDVLTAEIEHIDCTAIPTSANCQPTPSTIQLIQDKYRQKVYLQQRQIPLGEFVAVTSKAELQQTVQQYGLPLMLKSRLQAYDGKGNYVLKSESDIDQAIKALTASTSQATSDGSYMLYAEKWVKYKAELAVMVVRSITGEVRSYPAVETVQHDSICHVVIAPAQLDQRITARAQQIAEQAISTLEGAGIYGVELFLLDDAADTILLNEIAPRPHNSGHYTIEACIASQFENHVRAVMGLPLGDCSMKVPLSVMINVLGTGDEATTWLPCQVASELGGTVHWYGKSGVKQNRKVGHITFTDVDAASINHRLEQWRRTTDERGKQLNVTSSHYWHVDASHDSLLHPSPVVGIIMGSTSDHPTMQAAADMLKLFDIPHEMQVCSAHRTPEWMVAYAKTAASRGLKCIIAGAGGAAHLPGMVAAMTTLPVVGVPVPLKVLDGMDSLLSIVQMPRGVPVATVAIGNSTNAGILAARIIGSTNQRVAAKLKLYAEQQTASVFLQIKDIKQNGWPSLTAK